MEDFEAGAIATGAVEDFGSIRKAGEEVGDGSLESGTSGGIVVFERKILESLGAAVVVVVRLLHRGPRRVGSRQQRGRRC